MAVKPQVVAKKLDIGTVQILTSDQILASDVQEREFILVGGKDGAGKTTTIIAMAKWIEDTNPEAKFFVIDTEGGFTRVYRKWREDAPKNITFLRATNMDEVLFSVKYVMENFNPFVDWLGVESMARIWEFCFPYEARVRLADGSEIPIGEIVEKGLSVDVMTYNHATKKLEPKRVTGHFKMPLTEDVYQLDDLKLTGNHPVFTQEMGYITPYEMVDLDTNNLTMMRYVTNDCGQRKSVDAGSKGSYRWEPIGRCFNKQAIRKVRELQDKFCTRESTEGIHMVEIHQSEGLGVDTSTTICSACRETGEEKPHSTQVCDHVPSRVHKNIQHAVHKWATSSVRRVPESAVPTVVGCLVHGRWGLPAKNSGVKYTVVVHSQLGHNDGFSETAKCCFTQIQGDEEKRVQDSGNSFSGTDSISGFDKTLHSSDVRLQDRRRFASASPTLLTGHNVKNKALYWVREEFCPNTENESKLFNGVFQGGHENVIQTLPLKKQRRAYDSTFQLGKAAQRTPSPVQQSAIRSSEGWVYDIEVEGNHDFFANDILVHNSQDLAYVELAGVTKSEFLAKRRAAGGKGGPIPQPDDFWKIAKTAHDTHFVNLLCAREDLNVIMTTTVDKPPKDNRPNRKENVDRKEFREEFGIDAGLGGAPRLPYYPDTVCIVDRNKGKVYCQVLKDRGSGADDSRIEFDIPTKKDFAVQFFTNCR